MTVPSVLYASLQSKGSSYNHDGVPIITTGCLKSRENGNPGMPIFTGVCRYAPDSMVVMVWSEAYLILHMKPCRRQVLIGGNMIQRPCYCCTGFWSIFATQLK